jgi:hypothetical protein
MRLLLVIKKENVDLEKQVNKLNFLVLNKSIKAVLTLLFWEFSQIKAQERVPLIKVKNTY